MSKHKHIDKICCIAVVCALLLTILFMNGETLGIKAADTVMGYENRLFDTSRVHTIDIVMDDWDSFIETCENEEYSSCSVVIDGEAYNSVGIRGKGNTSLSSVSQMDSDRYSFKIEFDQYDSTKSYYGLDKLSLNNLIQDNTFMKDYLTYRMMDEFGVDAPLCSYVYITVNGEDWGLYLAVEGVEDAFLQRNYGSDHGELYKPDSMSFGGGRGNGKDFDLSEFDFSELGSSSDPAENSNDSTQTDETGQTADPSQMFGIEMPQGDTGTVPDMGDQMPEGDISQMFGGQIPQGDTGTMPGMGGQMPEGDISQMFGGQIPQGDTGTMPDMGSQIPEGDISQMFGGQIPQGGMSFVPDMDIQLPDSSMLSSTDIPSVSGGFGMGSSDVKLQYIDDDPDSYSNIFNNAKTDVTDADKTRLIESLKSLSSGEDIEETVDVEEVIRYFVVHNFVVNGDSYTGSMIHNYYLYEEDGQLSMIPWDYNLAYGTFSGSNASDVVNDPIDSPVSGGSTSDRPMIDWIFSSDEYTALYHRYFSEFIRDYFSTGYVDDMIASVTEMISPYVEKDPTKFCTYEEFQLGAETIRQFCQLRAESVSGQLSGTIPSTTSGQSADSSSLVDASSISLSAMGTMGSTMGGVFGGTMTDKLQMPSVSGSDIGDIFASLTEGTRPVGGRNTSDSDAADFSSGRSDRQDQFSGQLPGSMSSSGSTGSSASSWLLLAVSAVVLAAGLVIVIMFKRH